MSSRLPLWKDDCVEWINSFARINDLRICIGESVITEDIQKKYRKKLAKILKHDVISLKWTSTSTIVFFRFDSATNMHSAFYHVNFFSAKWWCMHGDSFEWIAIGAIPLFYILFIVMRAFQLLKRQVDSSIKPTFIVSLVYGIGKENGCVSTIDSPDL